MSHKAIIYVSNNIRFDIGVWNEKARFKNRAEAAKRATPKDRPVDPRTKIQESVASDSRSY